MLTSRTTPVKNESSAPIFEVLARESLAGAFLISEGKLEYANSKFAELLGFASSDKIEPGLDFLSLVSPRDRPLTQEHFRSLPLDPGKSRSLRFTALRHDGSMTRLELKSFAPQASRPDLICGTCLDVTDQENYSPGQQIPECRKRELLATLSAAPVCSARLADTLQKMADALVGDLCDWCTIDLNNGKGESRRHARAHRDPESRQVLDRMSELYPRGPRLNADFLEMLKAGRPVLTPRVTDDLLRMLSHDDRHFRLLKELEIASSVRLPLIVESKVVGWLAMISSSPSRSYSENDLAFLEQISILVSRAISNADSYQQAKDEIQQRDQFLSIATHELKTPLTSLHSLLQLMVTRAQSDPSCSCLDIVKKAQAQSARMLKLTEFLLDLSQINMDRIHLRAEATDLVQITHEALDRLESEIQVSGCEVSLISPKELPGRWDRARLQEVIVNLLSNALKYGKSRPIRIRIDTEPGEGGKAFADFAIEDRGPGIDPQDHARIFKPYERAASSLDQQGHGLGLYIVRQVLNAHGGTIGVNSAPGEGACFHFKIPCDPPIDAGSRAM